MNPTILASFITVGALMLGSMAVWYAESKTLQKQMEERGEWVERILIERTRVVENLDRRVTNLEQTFATHQRTHRKTLERQVDR